MPGIFGPSSPADDFQVDSFGVRGPVGPAPLAPLAPWAAGTVYAAGPPASFVSWNNACYACAQDHTSTVFAADLAAGRWTIALQAVTQAALNAAALAALEPALSAESTVARAAEQANASAISTETVRAQAAEALLAPLASPVLTGAPTALTPALGDNSQKLSTTAFVSAAVTAESARAQAAESTNATAITTEATAARNAANLTSGTVPAARLPGLAGDVTAPSGSTTTTLAASGVTAGTYGGSSTIPVITVDTKGRVTSATTAPIGGATAAASPGWQNKIINGAFGVNQRAVSGTVTLAAGIYGHDRWKGGASGATYTFATSGTDTTVTISAGTLLQIVEAGNVSATSFVLSWSGTATARIYQGSASGSYAASPLVVSGLTAGTALTVEFSTGTVTDVQLEAGSTATGFARRLASVELELCQRYYYRRASAGAGDFISVLSAYSASGAWGKAFDLPVEMRAVPTVAVSAASDLQLYNPGSSSLGSASSNGAMQASTRSISFLGGVAASTSPFTAGQAIIVAFQNANGWIAASAEL